MCNVCAYGVVSCIYSCDFISSRVVPTILQMFYSTSIPVEQFGREFPFGFRDSSGGECCFRFFCPANRFTSSGMTPCQVQVARLLSRSESCFRISGSIILARLDNFYLAHLASTFQRPPSLKPGSEQGTRQSLPKSQWYSYAARQQCWLGNAVIHCEYNTWASPNMGWCGVVRQSSFTVSE